MKIPQSPPRKWFSFNNRQSQIQKLLLLYGRSAANLEKHLAHGVGEGPVERATAGTLVASAAETLGYAGDVNFALAAQADAETPVGQLAEEGRHLDSADGENVIRQAFAIFLDGAAALHLLLRHPDVTDLPFDTQIAQSLAEQADLGLGVRKVDAASTVSRIGTGQHQLARQGKSTVIRPLEHKRTGIGHQRGVEAGGNLR